MNNLALGRGHVYHSRNGAIENQFRYPSFFLLFNCQSQPELTATLKTRFKGLFSVVTTDYLHGEVGALDQKVRNFIQTHCGFTACEIWLQTMPRIFGYAFNPVSFWFCRRDGKTEAVLCEVNNTFGERHFYWINLIDSEASTEWFSVEKVFHVSPFFPVDGHYKFRFQQSLQHSRVDINCYGTDDQLRLSTWIEGTLSPLSEVSPFELLLKYGWMTPLVVFRIHYQALKLFLKKAKFFRKPAMPSKEVSS